MTVLGGGKRYARAVPQALFSIVWSGYLGRLLPDPR